MKSSSANRSTLIKIVEEGSTIKALNASINYNQGYDALKKMIELSLRLSPQDPVYNVEQIIVTGRDGSDLSLEEFHKDLRENLTAGATPSKGSAPNKIVLSVHVEKSQYTNSNTRSISRGPVRRTNNDENSNSNQIREIDSARARFTTPDKNRRGNGFTSRGRARTPTTSDRGRLNERSERNERNVESKTAAFAEARNANVAALLGNTDACDPLATKQPMTKIEEKTIETSAVLSPKLNKIVQGINQTWKDVGQEELTGPKREGCDSWNMLSDDEFAEEEGESNDEQQTSSIAETQIDQSKSLSTLGMRPSSPTKTERLERSKSTSLADSPDRAVLSPTRCTSEDSNLPTKSTVRIVSSPAKKATPGKRGSLCVTSSVGSLNYARPLYAGNKTAAEQQKGFENSMRQYDHDKKRSEKKGRKASVDNALSPMLMKSSSNKDGRPSIGTITQQWEFMRTNFVNNSDEELEWLMVSKKPGAYKYAHKKNSLAEDKYFKALYDIDKMERRFKGLTKLNGTIIQLVSEISAHYTTLASNKSDQQALTSIEETQNTMKTFVEKNIEKEQTPLSFYSSKTEEGLQALISNPDKFKAARKARELSSIIPGELSTVKNSLALAQREADDALKNMEKWAKRETEAEEYQAVLLEEENMWMEKERAKNMEALASMRSFVPINISELSVHDLMENAKAQGGLMTIELAAELKNNKLLHWLVTHPDDIAKSNFLSGDKKSYFENLESLDIVELRAISVVLPKKFELDVDGKKAEWRSRFMTRVKQLVAQQNGDKVKGPWDENSRKRLMIDLPPLKGEQNRRSLYYYRSIEQIDQRLKQFDEKLELLAKKKTWLEKAEKEFSDAKKEYDIILIEMRDPDFRQLYGAEQLATVKELAKKEYLEADKNRKSLLSTVLQLQKSIDTSPITRDQYIAMKNELADFLSENGHLDWAMPNQSPIAIEGVFDPCPEIVKIERFAAKFVSAEEEAEKRKQELLMLTKKEEPIDIIVSEPLMEETVSSFLIKEDLANVDDPLAMTTGSLCCSNPQSLTARYLASASTDHNDQSEVAFAPRTPSRKHSILLSNPDFAATLNNLWSPGPEKVVARAKTPNRRGSIASFAVPKSVQKVEESISGTPKEPKKSQSKLLQKLLNPGTNEACSNKPRRFSMFSMTSGDNENSNVSFLDQIKNRKKASADSETKPMSFLDQIKCRGKPQPDSQGEKENDPNVVEAPKIISDSKPLGLLDAIKARRKD